MVLTKFQILLRHSWYGNEKMCVKNNGNWQLGVRCLLRILNGSVPQNDYHKIQPIVSSSSSRYERLRFEHGTSKILPDENLQHLQKVRLLSGPAIPSKLAYCDSLHQYFRAWLLRRSRQGVTRHFRWHRQQLFNRCKPPLLLPFWNCLLRSRVSDQQVHQW